MKRIKVAVAKKGTHDQQTLSADAQALQQTLQRLHKKGLNPMQICHKLIEHEVAHPEGKVWSYDQVVHQCQRFGIH